MARTLKSYDRRARKTRGLMFDHFSRSPGRFIAWLGVTASKFYDWRERYGRANEQNGWVYPEISGWSRVEGVLERAWSLGFAKHAKFRVKHPARARRKMPFE